MSSILHRGSSPGQSSHNRLCIIFCEPDTTTIIMLSFKAENSLIVFSNNIFAILSFVYHRKNIITIAVSILIISALSFCRCSCICELTTKHISPVFAPLLCPTVSNCPPFGNELIMASQLNCLSQTVYSGRWKHFVARCTLVQSSIMKTSRSKYNHKSASTLKASTM